MQKLNLTIALALTATIAANAGVVANLQAGKLSEAGIEPGETTLTISGQMNAADFAYIFDNLNALKELDLYNVNIVAYQGAALPYTGLESSPAAGLPDYALTGMTALEDITLPANLKTIGKGSLSGTGLTTLVVPESVTAIGDYAAMRCENLTSITVPAAVKTIGTRAFAYCPKLHTVDMSAQLTVVPEGLFEACGGLQTLSLERLTACKEIGPWAVADCNGLSSLVLPASSQALGKGSVYGVAGVQTLALPENLKYIDSNAMGAMTSLVELDVTQVGYVPDLGENVWGSLDQSNITLITPNELVDDYKDAPQWDKFKIVSQKEWENSTETIASTIDDSGFTVVIDGGILSLTSTKPMGHIAIFNVAGQRILSARAEHNAEISIASWAPGIYLVATEAGAAKIRI